MSNNFHSNTCELRHGGLVCSCRYVKPKTDKEVIAALKAESEKATRVTELLDVQNRLQAALDEARIIISHLPNYNIAAQIWLASHPGVILAGAKTESQKLDAADRADEDEKFESEGR
jgi:hypothetical protein